MLFFAIQVSRARRSCAFTEGSASFRSSSSADTEMVGSASTGVACTGVVPVRPSHHRRRSSVDKQSAGCAMESLNSTKACWSPDVKKKTAKQIKSTLPFYSNSTSSCNSNSVELHIANCCFNVPLTFCLAIKKARLLNALH